VAKKKKKRQPALFTSSCVTPASSFTSAPAANALSPDPVTTIARTRGSESAAAAAAVRSRITMEESALSCEARSTVRRATPAGMRLVGVEVSEMMVEVEEVDEKGRRAAVEVDVDEAIDDGDANDNLAAKLPAFGTDDDAEALIRSRDRDRADAARARAPAEVEGDMASRLVWWDEAEGRWSTDGTARRAEKVKKVDSSFAFLLGEKTSNRGEE